MKKDLYLMRHGQTLFNVRRKIQGWCDSPLTELGKQQALKAKENLKGISFDHYYSSTSERCCDTIELIIGDQYYKRLKGLKERNFISTLWWRKKRRCTKKIKRNTYRCDG